MAYVKLLHDFAKFIDPEFYAEIIKIDDEASSILRLQLLTERFLNVYLDERIPQDHKDFFGKSKNSEIFKYFQEKLRTAVAYGLPVDLAKALKSLNLIRNDFAHSFDAKLSRAKVNDYCALVDKFSVDTPIKHGYEHPVLTMKASFDGKQINAGEDVRHDLIIATFALMNKSGIWLVNDLNARGALRIE